MEDANRAVSILLAGARLRHKHAEECSGTKSLKNSDGTKTSIPCPMCAKGMEFFNSLSLPVLNQCLSEPQFHARVEIATLIVDSTFRRGTHNSKRSQRDCAEGMKLLRTYQENGGKLRGSI